jgi:hypothetical protein
MTLIPSPYNVTVTFGATTIPNIQSVTLPEEIREKLELAMFTGTGKMASVMNPDVSTGAATVVATLDEAAFTSLSPKKATSGAAEAAQDLVYAVEFDGKTATLTMPAMCLAGRSGGDFSRASETAVTLTFEQHDPDGSAGPITAVVAP